MGESVYVCLCVYDCDCECAHLSISVRNSLCDHMRFLISVCVIAYPFKTLLPPCTYLIFSFVINPTPLSFLPVEQAAAVSTIRATKDIQAAYAVPFDVNGKYAYLFVSLLVIPPSLLMF